MRFFATATLSLLLASAFPAPAFAASFLAEQDLMITSPISGDAYGAGGNVRVSERISGDLSVAGGNIWVEGPVSQDIAAAGGQIRIRGDVGDDIRAAGGDLQIAGNVAGDVVVFGGKVLIEDTSVISGDLVVNGGEITVQGRVRGNVIMNAGSAFIENSVDGNLTFHGGELYVNAVVGGTSTIVADSIRMGKNGLLSDPVEYWLSSGTFEFGEAAPAGATYNADLGPAQAEAKHVAAGAAVLAAIIGALATFSLLSAAFFIAIMILLTRTFFTDAAKFVLAHPWKNMLYGFLYVFVTPMIVLAFLLSLVGIPIAVAIGLFFFISLFFAKYLTAIVLARVWEVKKKWKMTDWQRILLAIFVFVLLSLVGIVPIIGWLASIAAMTISIGALLQAEWQRYLKVR